MNNSTAVSAAPGKSSGGFTPLAIGLMTGQFIMMVVMVGGNSIFILAIIKYRKLKTINSMFVANLSLSDLILGITMSFQISFFFQPWMEHVKELCILRFQFVNLFSKAALYSLCLTVIDRFIAITYPLKYPSIMTNTKAYVLIAIMWIYALTNALVPIIFDINTWDTADLCLYELVTERKYRLYIHTEDLLLSIFLMVCYSYIYIVVRRHKRKIATENMASDRRFLQDKKLAKFSIIIAIVFTICWLPFSIIQEVQVYKFSVTGAFVGNFAVFLGISNSAINPFIYTWKNPDFRSAIKKLLRLEHLPQQTNINSVESIS
ncbi:octopamine receptor 1-like [Haliotis rufescens]|uniref:octopamine receptor 1-like n=1 Tax=Haliotis rufescens TaxID=6454 RepID=UPI001EB04A58|nr:octopamine receptor 1-like [Haliotis rufescens]